ncbi:MAG: hypothetical protein V3W37_03175 [Candidatus Binatia bacterium]
MEEKKASERNFPPTGSVPTAEPEPGGWIEALCVNTRFAGGKLKRGTHVKLTKERMKDYKKAGRENFRLHKELKPELAERLKADGKLIE